MKISIEKLKNTISRLNIAIEKNKVNPKAGWIEFQAIEDHLFFKVSNFDYYLEAYVPIEEKSSDLIHATVSSDTFIPLISKLTGEYVVITQDINTVKLTTAKNEYTFPLIKDMGKVKCLDSISIDLSKSNHGIFSGKDLATISDVNVKGLDALFIRDIQAYIYVDNQGAITFTENIYVNDFNKPVESEEPLKFLLNLTQAKLMKVFEKSDDVYVNIMQTSPEINSRIQFEDKMNKIKLIIISKSMNDVLRFPTLKLRQVATQALEAHITVDKKELDKALSRLMVFDKKFDTTILNYSKIEFNEDGLILVSVLNKNYEKLTYIKSDNVFKRTFMIRFADLVKQLKALQANEVSIYYGNSPAIIIDSGTKVMLPEIVEFNRV